MEQQSSTHHDDALFLARLLGEIQFHHLGPAFMQALVSTVLGAEGLHRLQQQQSITSDDLWAVNSSTTLQRIEAAAQALKECGLDMI